MAETCNKEISLKKKSPLSLGDLFLLRKTAGCVKAC